MISTIRRFSGFRSPALSKPASIWLDVMRGVACVIVVIYHLRHLYFVGDASQLGTNVLQDMTNIVVAAGHPAVMTFFVLSGYLISASALRAVNGRRWSLQEYFIQRLSRLWIVLLPALLLGGIWDQLGSRLFSASKVYAGLPADQAVLNLAGPNHFAFGNLIANAFFIHETRLGALLHVQRFGTNGPIWSLSYEFWYYVAFGLLVSLIVARQAGLRLISLAGILAVLMIVGWTIVAYFPIWLLGFAIAVSPPLRGVGSRGRALAITSACGLVAAVLAYDFHTGIRYRSDILTALAIATLIYALCQVGSAEVKAGPKLSRLAVPAGMLAGFSYTLYLTHMPVLVFVHAWILAAGGVRWPFDALHLGIALVLLATILAFAWTVASVTEFHTAEFRRAMTRGVRSASRRGSRVLARNPVTVE